MHDSHIHSEFSFDGQKDGTGTVDYIAETAIQKGIDEISICDHCDIDDILDGIYPPYDADGVKAAIFNAKEKYDGKIRINYGIELGQAHARYDEAKKLLADYNYDFVIGSLHNLRSYPDFSLMRYAKMNRAMIEYLVRRTLSELLELINIGGIATIAHITYMHRYLQIEEVPFDYKPYYPQFEEIFKKMIEKGIALEVNTSGLRRGSTTLPYPELCAFYHEVGGELITLGSDAHFAVDIGSGIEEAAKFLREIGFKSQTVIRDGKPTQIEL